MMKKVISGHLCQKGLIFCSTILLILLHNRPFSKMAAENSNKLKLAKIKTYTSTRKNTFTLVTLQSFSISGEISAEKM